MVIVHLCDKCNQPIKSENIDRFWLTEIVYKEGSISDEKSGFEFCSFNCLYDRTVAHKDDPSVRYDFTVRR